MAKQLFANNATGYLASSITNVATTITIQVGQGSAFPSPTSGDYFYATLFDGSSVLEIVQVTAKSADTFTVVRAQQGTTASAFASGSKFELRATRDNFTNFVQLIGDQTVNGTKTFGNNPVLNAGAANSVPYLNASKVLTSGSALTFDGTTLTSTTFSGTLNGNASNVSGVVAVANGGTNATTGAQALINLGERTGDTGSAKLPAGTTAQRDASPSAGYFRYNTTNAAFEGYNGTAWTGVGGASGGGGNPFVYENDQTVSVNYTITTNKNGMTAGPISVANGIVVTVPNGSVWTIV